MFSHPRFSLIPTFQRTPVPVSLSVHCLPCLSYLFFLFTIHSRGVLCRRKGTLMLGTEERRFGRRRRGFSSGSVGCTSSALRPAPPVPALTSSSTHTGASTCLSYGSEAAACIAVSVSVAFCFAASHPPSAVTHRSPLCPPYVSYRPGP